MTDQEIWGLLGYALDMSKIGIIKWKRTAFERYECKSLKLEIFASLINSKVKCLYNSEDITEVGGELVQRLFKYVSSRYE